MKVWVIIAAAGTGSRFGGAKQFQFLGEKRVLDWSIDVAQPLVDGIVAVVSPDRLDLEADSIRADVVVGGGRTRSASVRAGLSRVPEDADVIVVHDAARPLAQPDLFKAVIAAVVGGADAAVPGVMVADTVKRVRTMPVVDAPASVVETLSREELVAVQTPQAFRADALRRAHATEPEASDDAGLVEALGGAVVVVPGDPVNIKLTLPHDLVTLTALAASIRR